MRGVAVTEGDKVEAQIKLGYSVNGFGVGDLAASVNEVSDAEVDKLFSEYEQAYVLGDRIRRGGPQHDAVRKAARIELGLQNFLETGGFKAFTDTFEDLHGLDQLPGIAVQRLMSKGYGFGGLKGSLPRSTADGASADDADQCTAGRVQFGNGVTARVKNVDVAST